MRNEEWKGVVASSSMSPVSLTGNATTDFGQPSNNRLAPACHFYNALDVLEMAMPWDATIPPPLMPTSPENVKAEMDLMEMIAQNNIPRTTF